ncbi:PHP domain-containing protein [Egibacter rhizosphaerae]|uniref:PHP domain-containing protein n=1 Tax=Egibacter rhizosphaerae TaxID=1670831 RepID=A0A411YJ27_9ACTN|nr:PHP domain-containing protein [Egibacter rhizosphaerae]QBI21223.1 PHP domain-containing protein [Egibacter rhizosphaerae]
MFDLHTHTIHSDGRTRPSENARLAWQAGLSGVAVTDHDTAAGWPEAERACHELGLEFVPGIELSAEDPQAGGRSVHILGYFVDAEDPALAGECARLRGEREARAERMVELLHSHGIELTFAQVREFAADAPIGRPHVAEALVAVGAVADTQQAFDRWLAEGQPAYVDKHAVTPEDAVALIRGAGGVAVLAHPGLDRAEPVPEDPSDDDVLVRPWEGAGSRSPADVAPVGSEGSSRGQPSAGSPGLSLDLLDRLTVAGLSGVEADHVAHEEVARRRWQAAAVARGLLVTGSSDFHGRYEDERIGSAATSVRVLYALRDRAADRPVDALRTEGSTPW